jgi:hypothetical protein
MRFVAEPTYKRFITGGLKRFDDRNTAFSRGAVEGEKYTRMHDQSLANLVKAVPGKTILDHATRVAGRTGDYIIRRAALGREHKPYYNKSYRLKNPDPVEMSRIIKEKAAWIGADLTGIARLNPLWIYTHWGLQNVMYSGAAKAGDPIEIPPEYKAEAPRWAPDSDSHIRKKLIFISYSTYIYKTEPPRLCSYGSAIDFRESAAAAGTLPEREREG